MVDSNPSAELETLTRKLKADIINELDGLYANELEILAKNIGAAAHDQIMGDANEIIEEIKKNLDRKKTPSEFQVVATQIRLIKESRK